MQSALGQGPRPPDQLKDEQVPSMGRRVEVAICGPKLSQTGPIPLGIRVYPGIGPGDPRVTENAL